MKRLNFNLDDELIEIDFLRIWNYFQNLKVNHIEQRELSLQQKFFHQRQQQLYLHESFLISLRIHLNLVDRQLEPIVLLQCLQSFSTKSILKPMPMPIVQSYSSFSYYRSMSSVGHRIISTRGDMLIFTLNRPHHWIWRRIRICHQWMILDENLRHLSQWVLMQIYVE